MKMPKHGTIRHKVLEYLLTGHSLDLPKAIAMWGHIRLSDAIHSLRGQGHNITTDSIEVPHSDTTFAFYRLSRTPWAGTPRGTPVRVLQQGPDEDYFSGKEGTVVNVTPGTPYPVLVEMTPGKAFPFNFDELEVLYAPR